MHHKGVSRHKIIGLFLPLLFLIPSLQAQNSIPAGSLPDLQQIHASEMKAMLTFLASDELEGRETGERGLQVAARYLESQYRLAGLTPPPGHESMLQSFYLFQSKVDPTTNLTVVRESKNTRIAFRYSLYNDFIIISSIPQSMDMEAPIFFAGYGVRDRATKYDDLKGIPAKGSFVVFFGGTPDFIKLKSSTPRRGKYAMIRELRDKARRAKQAGALAVWFVSEDPIPELAGQFRRWLSRGRMSLLETEPDPTVVIISKAIADDLLSEAGLSVGELKNKINTGKKPFPVAIKNAVARLELNVRVEQKLSQNVVAYLEGSDSLLKQEVVAFSAHYDHLGVNGNGEVFNGADDDGSGTIGILEIARAFARNPIRPKRSLLFISHTGEEKGLLGSSYYVQHPWVPLNQMVALLNIDMIGRNGENSVYIIGSDFLSSELHRINEKANEAVRLHLDYKYNNVSDPNRFYFRSDHYNYARHGVPIIFYFAGIHKDYHQPSDTVEKISFTKMEKIVRLVYLTGWRVADLDHRLRVDRQMNLTDH